MPSKYRSYLAEMEQWPFIYAYRFFLQGGSESLAPFIPIFDQAMPIRGDADFIARAWTLDQSFDTDELVGLSPTDVVGFLGLRFRTFDGSRILSLSNMVNSAISIYPQVCTFHGKARIQSTDLNNDVGILSAGTAQDPLPILPERYFTKSSVMFADIQPDQNVNPLWVEIAFHGVKLHPKGTHYSIDKTRRWRTENFTYQFQLPAPPAGTTIPNNRVTLDGDSVFMLLGVYSTQVTAKGYSFSFYGPNGENLDYSQEQGYLLPTTGLPGGPVRPSMVSGGNCVGSSRRL